MIIAFLSGILLQAAVVYIPFMSGLFKTLPISLSGWLLIAPLSLAPLFAHELEVLIRKVWKNES